MRELLLTQDAAAPAGVVWDVLVDLEAAPSYTRGIETLERLDGGTEVGVGTRWSETRVMFGRSSTEEMEITSIEAGRSYVVESEGHGARYRTVLEVVPKGADHSELRMKFGAESTGLVAKVLGATLGRLAEGATRKACQQDLVDIAAEAARRATG